MKEIKTEKKSKFTQELVLIQIGKNGITENLMGELEDQLKRKKSVKVKILKNSPYNSREEAFEALRQRLPPKVKLVEIKGWTVIINSLE